MSAANETPLSVALAASKPIDIQPRQPLEVERLLTESQRRITVDDHHRWQETLCPPHHDDADLATERLETPNHPQP